MYLVLNMIFAAACELPDGRVIAGGAEFDYSHKGSPVRCLCPKDDHGQEKMEVKCHKL